MMPISYVVKFACISAGTNFVLRIFISPFGQCYDIGYLFLFLELPFYIQQQLEHLQLQNFTILFYYFINFQERAVFEENS